MDNLTISMTKDQSAALSELQSKVEEAAKAGNPGSLIAQVFPDADKRFFICRFVPGEEVLKMYEAMGLEPPKLGVGREKC